MTLRREGSVAHLTLPAWLDADACAALLNDLRVAEAEDGIAGLVLTGGGDVFCNGFRLNDHATADLRALAQAIEGSRLPVIAAIGGDALAAGCELALAAHLRIAVRAARIGLPRIAIGLPPSAQATRRLPALVGAEHALEMLLGGRPVAASEAPAGLIDLIDGDPVEAAAALVAAGETPPGRTGMADPGAYLAAVAAARGRAAMLPVRRGLIDCVEAALLLPPSAADAKEAELYDEARASDAAVALGHLARVERRNAERASDTHLPDRVAVIGDTAMAARLSMAALVAGSRVDLIALDAAGRDRATERIIDALDAAVAAGRMDDTIRERALSRFYPDIDMTRLGEADVIVEAATPDRDLRLELARAISLLSAPRATLIYGGADADPASLSDSAQHAHTIGLHLPAGAVGLAEIAIRPATDAGALSHALALARGMGLRALLTGPQPRRVVEPLADASLTACEDMLTDGASPDAVADALGRLGLIADPLAQVRARGIARVAAWRAARGWGRGGILSVMAQAGLDDLADAPAVAEELRRGRDGPPPPGSPQAMAMFWHARVTDRAARLIESGAVRETGDLDIASLGALGLPRVSGGVRMFADRAGLLRLVDVLRARGETASPLLEQLIREGRTLHGL